MAGTKVYKAWKSMRERCSNPNAKSYARYGARGIRVCERWQNFPNFLSDMGDLPAPGYTLERIDNDGHYEPRNCKWVPRIEQYRNTSRNVFLEINGERKTVAEWSRSTGINLQTLWTRLYSGWPPEQAVSPRRRKNAFC